MDSPDGGRGQLGTDRRASACLPGAGSPARYLVPPQRAAMPVAPPATLKEVLEQPHPRALSMTEQAAVLEVLHSPRCMDAAPAEAYAILLDEGVYLASVRTMYRLLAQGGKNGGRRKHRSHSAYHKPELLATGPNQVWIWDMTKLPGPQKWTYCYLYVILDIFSRYVVGWMAVHQELATLAERLIAETSAKQQVPPGQFTLHADRGSSITSKLVAFLLADLGITKTHSRPAVSNDKPYSESQFKTLKYRPGFPERFAGCEEARSFCQEFFPWYNRKHRHAGIGLLNIAGCVSLIPIDRFHGDR